LAITDHTNPAQARLGFAEVGPDKAVWELARTRRGLKNRAEDKPDPAWLGAAYKGLSSEWRTNYC
jgi:hypothetical protein